LYFRAVRQTPSCSCSDFLRSTEPTRAVLVRQCFFPPELLIFDRNRLVESHCLEHSEFRNQRCFSAQRAGTGNLGLALVPLARTFTMTGFESLIQKNVSLNSPGWHDQFISNSRANITNGELDWITIASLPLGTVRARYCLAPNVTSAIEDEFSDPAAWNLIFAIDCIYNPSLLPALVTTIGAV
jgi:protein N-lysine methyltransferase METTL21D